MNNTTRTGFIFGIGMPVLFILDSLLSGINHSTSDVVRMVSVGIVAGAIGGLVVGFLLAKLKSSKVGRNSTKANTRSGNK